MLLGPSLIPLVGRLKPSINQILFSFWPGCWTLDAAWLMGRRFSDRSLCSTSAGSDDQSLWKFPGLRSPFGAFVFQLLGLNQHSYPTGPFSCLPHSPACALCSLSTVPTNCREGSGGEESACLAERWRENTHGNGRLRLLLSAQIGRCPRGPSSNGLGWKEGRKSPRPFFLSHVFSFFFPFPLPIPCFLFLFHLAFMP